MTAFQPRDFDIQIAQDYFAQLNPLAQRIASDIRVTQATYGQLWYTLKLSEQNDILNDTLINPEISLKYFDNFSSSVPSLSSNSTSSSSGDESANTAERILLSLPENKEHDSNFDTDGVPNTSLSESFLKQTQNLLPVTTIPRSQHVTSAQLHGKLKPPSSPPPPPPIGIPKTPPKPIEAKTGSGTEKKKRSEHTKLTNEVKSCAFDGRNLCTYAAQKVALKIVFDDVLGAYRDEHSRPFSYLTSSQINLQQQYKQANLGDITLKAASNKKCLFSNSASAESTTKNRAAPHNYEKFQKELQSTLNSQLGKLWNEPTVKINRTNNIIYKHLHSCNDKDPANDYDAGKHPTSISQQVSKTLPRHVDQATLLQKVNPYRSDRTNFSNDKDTANVSCLFVSPTKQQNLSYAVYTDGYFEVGESATLMRNSGNSQILTASSNSSTTSEEDHNNYEYDDGDDEKTLCEDIRLLKNDLNLRREFDFLNNW